MFKDEERHRLIRPYVLGQFVTSVMTDDERAEYWGLPAGCRMRENAKIISPDKLVCGEFVWIGEGAVLDASGGLEIGAHTSIGLNVMVWSHSSHLANLSLDNRPGSDLIDRRRTRIGKGCFIAGPSVIYPGVTIGDRCMVLPMSVVTADVPDCSLIAGAPAQLKKQISEEWIAAEIARRRGE
jgi:acetyltransferase-like isoleucine patch superfamily enzyme